MQYQIFSASRIVRSTLSAISLDLKICVERYWILMAGLYNALTKMQRNAATLLLLAQPSYVPAP